MDENKHKSLGWFIVLLKKWPANKDFHSGKYRLRKFFEVARHENGLYSLHISFDW